jgi:hypothetical protein
MTPRISPISPAWVNLVLVEPERDLVVGHQVSGGVSGGAPASASAASTDQLCEEPTGASRPVLHPDPGDGIPTDAAGVLLPAQRCGGRLRRQGQAHAMSRRPIPSGHQHTQLRYARVCHRQQRDDQTGRAASPSATARRSNWTRGFAFGNSAMIKPGSSRQVCVDAGQSPSNATLDVRTTRPQAGRGGSSATSRQNSTAKRSWRSPRRSVTSARTAAGSCSRVGSRRS